MKPKGTPTSGNVEKVIWKDTDSTATAAPEFCVFAVPGMVEKWRNDKSVPMVDVLDVWQIYEHEGGGNTGVLNTPSNKTLKETFGSHSDVDVITRILQEGNIQGSNGPRDMNKNSLDRDRTHQSINETRGSLGGKILNKHQGPNSRATVHG
ncbi:ribosome maturation protein [Gaertneriomyces semiglobifer]|nr:ribosome maturation protein [Gaertneriomyces semiglobifer]